MFALLGTLTSALSVLLIVLGDGRCVLSGHIELSALFLFGPKKIKQKYFLGVIHKPHGKDEVGEWLVNCPRLSMQGK